jgi:predicted dehydrogenase
LCEEHMSIAIIGTGWGTRVQIPAFRAAGLDIVAIVGRDGAKTRRLAQELEIGFATDDWREVLRRDDVRLVSIITPPNLHKEMAIAALEAGKHVLCEKPMAMDSGETETMVAAAAAHPALFALIDHELRFLPSLLQARQQVTSGRLGKLHYVEASVSTGARRNPSNPWTWWSDAEQGGGVLGAMGSHMIDTIQFLFSPIAAVSGQTHTFIRERPSDSGPRAVTADDYSALLFRLQNNAIGTIRLSSVAGITEPTRLTAHFEQGALRIENGRLLLSEGDAFRDITPADTVDVPEKLRESEFPRGTVYLGHALKQALGGDTAALAPAARFADGDRVQRVLDAARRSSAAGSGWVEL